MFKFCSNNLRENLEITICMVLILSCIYSVLIDPHITCTLTKCTNHKASTMMSVFPRAIAIGCMISKCTVMYKNLKGFNVYQKKTDRYKLQYPTSSNKVRFRRIFIASVVCLCVILILPINAYKLYLNYIHYRNFSVTMVFICMYTQNASMCIMELRFVARCFDLYQKFQAINEDMCVLKSKSIVMNRFPSMLKTEDRCAGNHDGSSSNNDNGDAGFTPEIDECSLVNSVELLRMRHKFVSDLVSDLNDLYSIQLGLSLSVLFIMSLLDIYNVFFTQSSMSNIKRSNLILLYGWLLQYGFRFCMIVLTAHATTKQANKSKSLITDINDRYTDENAEEELRLFLNELSSRSMEFTPFDLFILNTRIITSALVAGTTYLVILSKVR